MSDIRAQDQREWSEAGDAIKYLNDCSSRVLRAAIGELQDEYNARETNHRDIGNRKVNEKVHQANTG